jgi:hypothetical protein
MDRHDTCPATSANLDLDQQRASRDASRTPRCADLSTTRKYSAERLPGIYSAKLLKMLNCDWYGMRAI